MSTMIAAPPVATGWWQARRSAYECVSPLGVRSVPLAEASGLVLAEGLRTVGPVPRFDTAAMDGYAVAGAGPWTVVGRVRPGAEPGRLVSGEAVEISTGAELPVGAEGVLRVESAERQGDLVSGPVPPSGTHIRHRGEDAVEGAVLARAGVGIGPALLGLAATCGHDDLVVRVAPRVTVLVTGDELVHAGSGGDGRIRDALGPMLPPLIAQLGGTTVGVHHVGDEPGRLAEAVAGAEATSDVVVVTGSTSVGTTDQLRALIATRGARPVVDTVACRPGHPQLLAILPDRCAIVGLPGNPLAALVAAHTLLGPVLARMAGRDLPSPPRAVVTGKAQPARGATRLVPVTWRDDHAQIVGGNGSAFLGGAAVADALAVLEPGWSTGSWSALVLL